MFGLLIPPSWYICAALTLTTVLGFGYGKYEANKLEAYKVAQVKIVQEKQQEYQTQSDQIRRSKDAQIEAINSQYVDAISELRKRSSRSQAPTNGQNSPGTTGATLFAEDAEFLIREAARADKIRIALESCYKQYDSIK
jgi:hypothetical protein